MESLYAPIFNVGWDQSYGERFVQDPLFSRIHAIAQRTIISKLEIHGKPLSDHQLRQLEQREWSSSSREGNFILSALQSYLDHRLTKNALLDFFLYDAVVQQTESLQRGEIPPCSYFELHQWYERRGVVNEVAHHMMREATKPYLKDDHFEKLSHVIQKLEPHETKFFLVLHEKRRDLFHAVSNGMNHFLTYEKRNRSTSHHFQLVPTPKLLEEILRSRFSTNFMQPLPAIGYADDEEMTNRNERVLFIPSPLLVNATLEGDSDDYLHSEMVHGYLSSPLSVYHHDIYHLLIESANIHRPLWIKWALFLRELGFEAAARLAFDRQFIDYLSPTHNDQAKFWLALICHIEHLHRLPDGQKKSSHDILQHWVLFHQSHQELFTRYEIDESSLDQLIEDYPKERMSLSDPRWISHHNSHRQLLDLKKRLYSS